jgi:hypothetical protein
VTYRSEPVDLVEALNAIHSPSGDQAGSSAPMPWGVTRRNPDPSLFAT